MKIFFNIKIPAITKKAIHNKAIKTGSKKNAIPNIIIKPIIPPNSAKAEPKSFNINNNIGKNINMRNPKNNKPNISIINIKKPPSISFFKIIQLFLKKVKV